MHARVCVLQFSVVDGYELHVTDEDDCFMEYGPNHCDGRATGLPVRRARCCCAAACS